MQAGFYPLGRTWPVSRSLRMAKLLSAAWRLIGAIAKRPLSRGGRFGLLVCICAALIGTEVWQLWRVYEANIEEARLVTSNSAQSIAEQAESAIKTTDSIVASLVERVEAEGTGPEALKRFYGLMTSLDAALPVIHELGITDSQGNAIVKSLQPSPVGLNYADREYFRFHATHLDRGSFVGARVKSKTDGSYDITVTRRINRPDGSFGGVVIAGVAMKYFQQLFDRIQAKSGGVIALLGDNSSILARSPSVSGETTFSGGGELAEQMQRKPAAGSLPYTSPLDGVRRYGSYQHFDQYPLSALVSHSQWDVQRSWRAELRWHAIILGCVIIVVVVLGAHTLKADRVLNVQAMQDGLTGLANRRFFNETIEREFRRAARSNQLVSIIMIDIDHFKAYNDCYGHPAGDECLRAIANTIRGCLRREGEVAARYGGEEIAVILPNSDAPRAYALAARMRLAVRGLGLQHAGSAHGIVTLSAGVAGCLPGRNTTGWQALVGRADRALYEAKASGRDSVKAATVCEIRQAA
jgi:diguanylate cyclase (GGDEF)-like protein